jgi:hypothetical protein
VMSEPAGQVRAAGLRTLPPSGAAGRICSADDTGRERSCA